MACETGPRIETDLYFIANLSAMSAPPVLNNPKHIQGSLHVLQKLINLVAVPMKLPPLEVPKREMPRKPNDVTSSALRPRLGVLILWP